ncbi:LppP/LprE family lipoprotein [Rhodococcus sp. G-MC3]|uniref:LppP/LprE family lipoprotein n=1 Tax=Rhodococcus sp. G-MC3 TaxID=3046209 RepID=UPI0024B952A3|nr:LppP/LprE family lipoprotein [Rhodococcus sp. G-MC3]MDJ0396125.1 LppP/LprE family lipoprotein [Rhodococcus sp. G-MC3]
MSPRFLAGLAVVALFAVGCGQAGTGAAPSGSLPSGSVPSGAGTSTSSTTTVSPMPETTTAAPVGGGSPSCVEDSVVQAGVESLPQFIGLGWKVYEKGDLCATLSWVLAYPIGATGSSPWTVLFFHNDTYLGTATLEPYAFTSIAGQTDDTVTVAYKWLREGESTAGVSGGPALIRYRWNGASVEMLDELPAEVTNNRGDNPGDDPAPIPQPAPDPTPAPDLRCIDRAAQDTAMATLPPFEGRKWEMSTYTNECLPLTWFLARPASRNRADDPQYLLFFHDGQYLGTANEVPYPNMSVAETDYYSVTINYGWRVPGDDEYHPGASVPVHYQWDGSQVVTTGTIPVEVTG